MKSFEILSEINDIELIAAAVLSASVPDCVSNMDRAVGANSREPL